jgi:hypothetical protein
MPWKRSNYPDDWEDIRWRILERAGHKCEWCGAPEHACIVRPKYERWKWLAVEAPPPGQQPAGVTVILTTAHLDHQLTDHSDGNLAALCQRCHLIHDLRQHIAAAARARMLRREQKGQLRLWRREE